MCVCLSVSTGYLTLSVTISVQTAFTISAFLTPSDIKYLISSQLITASIASKARDEVRTAEAAIGI